jgi:GGDEF domain-containing protein
MFESPRKYFGKRVWLLSWVISFTFPSVLFFRHALLWIVSSGLLVGFTYVCWRYRHSRPEASLIVNLLGIFCFTACALWLSGLARNDASIITLFMVISILPLTALTSLRPIIGLGTTLATVLLMSFQANENPLPTMYFPPLIATFLGLLIAAVLQDYERIHASLSEAAVTDPTTGLGNFYSLKLDFRRYQALAQREQYALLLIRWGFENVKEVGYPAASPQVPYQFAHFLTQSIRQGDSLYYLGEREFMSLHPRLETGTDLAARVQQIYPNVQVSWARGENKTLVETLERVKKSATSVTPPTAKNTKWLS